MAFNQGVKATTAAASSLASAATNFSGSNFLASIIVVPASNTVSSFVDSSSNTWVAHPSTTPQTITGTNSRAYCYTVTNPTVSASQTFTANFASADIAFLAVIGLSGRATASAIDASGYTSESTGVTNHTGGATASQSVTGDDIIALFWDDEGVSGGRSLTYTAGSGFTLPGSISNADGRFFMTGGIEYQENVGTTGVTTTWTSSSANIGAGYILAVKAAAGSSAFARLPYPNYVRHFI